MKLTVFPIFLLVVLTLSIPVNIAAQNERADGYRGLWSRSGQLMEFGYKYSGGLATFSSQHTPLAVYSAEANKTFFIYSGTKSPEVSHLQIMISYYDHRTNRVPRPVIIYDKMGVNDPQDNATISIDSRGFIYVFVSGRGRTRPGLIFRSREPYTIDAFDQIFRGEIVFPQPWWINDSCLVLMHTRVRAGRELFWSTSVDGRNWSAGKKLAGMGGHHQITNVNGNIIYSVFNYLPGGNRDLRTNIYLVKTDDVGKTWTDIDGNPLNTPLTDIHSSALVKDYETDNKIVFIKDLNFDRNGNPVILALTSGGSLPGPSGDPRELMIIKREDGKWKSIKVFNTHHNHDMGSLFTGVDEWKIVYPAEPGPRKDGTGGEIVLWTSNDEGETWRKKTDVTAGSRYNNSYVRRPLNANSEFYCYWADGDPEQISESRIFFTNENCDRVWMLPYTMKKSYARPQRIK
ncbi:MAG TPA: BNR-4 repeat-containing protein [Bacteroidales bacterium]|nr:BNR-4 repeat-containing protein [Bacteroidales bacterium]